MSIHPARLRTFDELADALAQRVTDKLVRMTAAPEDPELRLYAYTQAAAFGRVWDDTTLIARGLVLHHGRREVLATPFPKFFNYGEQSLTLPSEPFRVEEKLDGSLGIVFHDGARWRVTTRGGWTSPQALWAQAWLDARDTSALVRGTTYLFEIIYAANRIVVAYPFEGLVALSAYGVDGCEIDDRSLALVAQSLDTRTRRVDEFASVDDVVRVAAALTSQSEGFVVRFASGYRVKIKGAEYVRVHRLIHNVTPLSLWDAMRAGDDLAKLRAEIPEEFAADFDSIRRIIGERVSEIVDATNSEVARWEMADNRAIGLALDTIPEPARSFIFAARKHGPQWFTVQKPRDGVFRSIRPSANVLPGYTPSAMLVNALEDT